VDSGHSGGQISMWLGLPSCRLSSLHGIHMGISLWILYSVFRLLGSYGYGYWAEMMAEGVGLLPNMRQNLPVNSNAGFPLLVEAKSHAFPLVADSR